MRKSAPFWIPGIANVHSLGTDEVVDEVPPNINVLRPTVKDWVLG